MKKLLLGLGINLIMGAIALGIGVWYLSSSLGGASLTYTSVDKFMNTVASVDSGTTNVANVNGCFLCEYVNKLFSVLGNATEMFWNAIVNNLWILMVIGYGIFLFIYTVRYILTAAKQANTLDDKEKKLDFKAWFEGDGKNAGVWRPAMRVMIAGVLIGIIGMGGTDALRFVANLVITPVLYIGALLAMAATHVLSGASCDVSSATSAVGILSPISGSFMCVIGNLNSVMLAGAAGGFALMNYAWLGLGGGVLTWVAGLALVILFLIIGFDLFFKILTVIFKLIFLIIFLPIFIAAYAFEPMWSKAKGLATNGVTMLVKSAVKIIGITLKIVIIYGVVTVAADAYFPGDGTPDGYSSIMPPMLGMTPTNPDAQTMSVMNAFSKCEQVSIIDGEMNADAFKECFNNEKAQIERVHPGAFDFMKNGWDFLLLMFGIFFLYYYVVSPKVDTLLGGDDKEMFDFGGWVKSFGKTVWGLPRKAFDFIGKIIGKF